MIILFKRKNSFQDSGYILFFIISWYDGYLFQYQYLTNRFVFLQHCPVENLSQFLFGMHREISLHHPIVILWFRFKYVSYRPSFVLPEVKDFHAIFHGKSTGEINNLFIPGEFNDAFRIGSQLGIADNLGHQDFKGYLSIRLRPMSSVM